MKITQVTPGLIPIPPNGWGAVEKIIWEYHCNSNLLGHESVIKYLDEVESNSDVVHIHVANLALLAHERGIKYVFTLHDHHAYVHGKNSFNYKQNLEAIDKSELSFVPAKFLIGYFGNHPKLRYLEHGVNTDYFIPGDELDTHRLLCVANNGFAHDQGFDRKGFSYAIQSAKILNLPLTIAGPSNNKLFFERYRNEYDKLTILYDLSEDDLLKTYREHTIFLHPSILEAGHPNLTLLEAMSCGLPIVGTYEPGNELPGLYRVERDVYQLVTGINTIMNDYVRYKSAALTTAAEHSFNNITKKLINYYPKKNKNMKEQIIEVYENTKITPTLLKRPKSGNQFLFTFVNGARVEILGEEQGSYRVEFIDLDRNELVHVDTIGNNCWTQVSRKFQVNWSITVYNGGVVVAHHLFNPTKKNVYITLESKAIGDTIAWFPVLEEYRKQWDCNLTVSTFHNEWFESKYTNIKFVNPGEGVPDLYAMFNVGWFYAGGGIDYNKNRSNFRLLPLQQTATDILNLPAMEVKPMLNVTKLNTNVPDRFVTIAPHGSAHAKYWNYPGGWQKVVDHITSLGFKVVLISQEKLGDPWHDSKLGGTLKNVIDKSGDLPIEDRMADILNSELFIGIGSGLSWISWALGAKTMLISGFSEPYSEFSECIRIGTEEPGTCTGCYNKFKLDGGDWNWCPVHRDDPDRIFECTKAIKPEQIISEIDKILA